MREGKNNRFSTVAFTNAKRAVDWISGTTLERISINYPDGKHPIEKPTYQAGDIISAWVVYPTDAMLDIFCDKCTGRRHCPTNLFCSASLGITSPYMSHTEARFFDFHTRQLEAVTWTTIEEISNRK